MSGYYRILLTGSRQWDDLEVLSTALDRHVRIARAGLEVPVLIHGDAQDGADAMADWLWEECYGFPVHAYAASGFKTPLARNLYMVDLGANVCLAFATRWASGTGHCARAARRAGIHTIDEGVSTE